MTTDNRAPSHHECREMLDVIVRATDALHYLNTLLDLAVNSAPECLTDQHSGLARLMGRQLEDIGNTIEPLRSYVARREHDTLPDESGRWVVLPTYRPEMDQEPRAKAAPAEAADALCAADLERVAKDTNLAESTVRRVVERLLAEPSGSTDAVASNG